MLILLRKLLELLEQIAVCIGNAICEEYLIVIVLELVLETEPAEGPHLTPLVKEVVAELGLSEGDVAGFLLPGSSRLEVFLLGKDEWLHALFLIDPWMYFQIEVAVLADIADIQLHAAPLATVSYCEVVPEGVSPGVRVHSQEQIVLAVAHLHHAVQVCRFELRIKHQLCIGSDGWVHPFEGAVVYCCFVVLVLVHRLLTLMLCCTPNMLLFTARFRSNEYRSILLQP